MNQIPTRKEYPDDLLVPWALKIRHGDLHDAHGASFVHNFQASVDL